MSSVAAAALSQDTTANSLTGFTVFIPKDGLRSQGNLGLYSVNLVWVPGHNCRCLIVIFAEFFLREKHIPKAGGPGWGRGMGTDHRWMCLIEN